MTQTSAGRASMVQGRIVWVSGNLFTGRPKVDQQTKQPKIGKDGKQMIEYGFGLAVPKSILTQENMVAGKPAQFWVDMHEEAYLLYPNRQLPPGFAMKYKDGDGIDDKGISFAQREGYAGHIVLACTTSIPIKFFRFENGNNILINEGIKCGDYVNVQLHVKSHPAAGTSKAGLYLNPNAVQFLGYGKEIINAPSGDQIFGTQLPAVPTGASVTPLAPQPGMLVPTGAPMAAPGFPPPAAAPAYPQQPAAYPPAQAAPQQPAPPHYGVLPPMHQPAQIPGVPQGYPQQAQPAGYPPPQYQPAAPSYSPPPPAGPTGVPMAAPGFPPIPGQR